MRAMWKGSVSFGLVNIPIKMYVATHQHDVSFKQVRRTDGSRVRYRRVAETDGEEVAYGDIAKGYELDDGSMVVLTDDDFAELPLPTKRTIEVLEFVPLDQLDPVYFNKSYYLEPEGAPGLKPYVLLREALNDSEMVAIVKITISTREQLAALRVREDVLVLSTMLWPDELRAADFDFLDQDVSIRAQEQAMANSLVTSMSGDFDPSEYTDDFADALKSMIDAKLEGGEVTPAASTGDEPGDNVVDLMSALQASVDRASSGAESDDEKPETKAASTKKATKKTTKKSSTKKSTAKKATKKASAGRRSA
ncbi:non-homologous end joining protein Ku [Solicola gregarius]|uniref:Non-homologous end joining protein Ku n=1 Tax=Solicola gregarius TaxID=2908642 RepID=A0AA46TH34_9ACTN|nr:Ku protein [Solicola gregarius]UYM04714.1 Ku protein [Solicola gregarius]